MKKSSRQGSDINEREIHLFHGDEMTFKVASSCLNAEVINM